MLNCNFKQSFFEVLTLLTVKTFCSAISFKDLCYFI